MLIITINIMKSCSITMKLFGISIITVIMVIVIIINIKSCYITKKLSDIKFFIDIAIIIAMINIIKLLFSDMEKLFILVGLLLLICQWQHFLFLIVRYFCFVLSWICTELFHAVSTSINIIFTSATTK